MKDLEEKIIESYDAIQKINDKAKAGKFKTTEDYKKAILKYTSAKAVFVINPTYFGAITDLKEIVRELYKKSDRIVISTNGFYTEKIVDLCKEFKYCNISSDLLTEKAELLEDGFLKEKLQDITLINDAYDALVKQSYFDDIDSVNMLSEFALNNNVFKGKTVFIDGFRSFLKQEADCFDVMISQADDVYVSLCTDENAGKYTPFYYIKEFETRLRAIANKCSVGVNEIYCSQTADSFSSDIFMLEKNIFQKN